MPRLIHFQPCSLDLRIADAAGDFGWAEPSESVHAFANDLTRPIATHVLGRRMWQTMRFWESMPQEDSVMGEFGALWRGADKVVVSASLPEVDTARTELLRAFDPDDLRRRKAEAAGDLAIGGAALASAAYAAGLVDEVQLLLVPVLVGSGPRALPDGVSTSLRLQEQRVLEDGWVFLRYAVGAA